MDNNFNNMNNGYNSYYPNQNQNQSYNQKPKKKGGFLKKLLTGCLVGLMFGIFMGVGFEVISYTKGPVEDFLSSKGIYKDKDAVIAKNTEETVEDTDEDEVALKEDADDAKKDKEAEEKELKEKQKIAKVTVPEETEYSSVYDVSNVASSVMPSVVAVNNKYTEKMQYFGQIYSQEAESAGSGIIVGKNESELLIVTNNHVVEKADELAVTFVNDDSVAAQIKGTQPDRDLAVIAVQLVDVSQETIDQIAIAQLGNSDALIVGEPVIAIGNALGYGQSVTTGVVSALDRAIAANIPNSQMDSEINTFIQTDAAINPGNSGGALLNMKGEVIGINSNKIGGSTVEGIGYAIPISDAKPIIDELMHKDTKLKVAEESKGYLGITGISVEREYAEVYGMPMGVYVSSVTEGTGAERAGLIRGDIIVAVNGDTITSMDDLREELEYYTAGTKVELTIMQGSPTGYKDKTVEVVLGEKVE